MREDVLNEQTFVIKALYAAVIGLCAALMIVVQVGLMRLPGAHGAAAYMAGTVPVHGQTTTPS